MHLASCVILGLASLSIGAPSASPSPAEPDKPKYNQQRTLGKDSEYNCPLDIYKAPKLKGITQGIKYLRGQSFDGFTVKGAQHEGKRTYTPAKPASTPDRGCNVIAQFGETVFLVCDDKNGPREGLDPRGLADKIEDVFVKCIGPKLPDKDLDYEVFAFQRWVAPEGKGDTKLPGYNIVVKGHEGEDVSNDPKLRQSDDDTVPQTNPNIDDPAKMAQYRKDNGFA